MVGPPLFPKRISGTDMTDARTETALDGDQQWADLLSPGRRRLLIGSGLAAAGALAVGSASAQTAAAGAPAVAPAEPSHPAGQSPWGYETYKEPATRPLSVRPGEQTLPTSPRAYTDIRSYHAHIYFDDDTWEKAALIRQWRSSGSRSSWATGTCSRAVPT
jgi:hypothetical protein